MAEDAITGLQETDRKALEILSKAGRQYEEYLRITDTADLVTSEEEWEDTARSWDHPLTLVLDRE